jgi:FixJ family two-component response regulator
MATLSQSRVSDLLLIDARAPPNFEPSPGRASQHGAEAKEPAFAERRPISRLYPIETRAIALHRSLADGRRQVIGLAFVVAGRGGVPMAVEATKAGAVDFIEMPLGRKELLAAVEHEIDGAHRNANLPSPRETDATRVASLTMRQRQVLDLVLAGFPSKNIAADLGISQRTVDNHRAAIMRKTRRWRASARVTE